MSLPNRPGKCNFPSKNVGFPTSISNPPLIRAFKLNWRPVKLFHLDWFSADALSAQTNGGTLEVELRSTFLKYTVEPLLSGHPRGFKDWPPNRGWPFTRGIEYCSLKTLKQFGTLKNGRLIKVLWHVLQGF